MKVCNLFLFSIVVLFSYIQVTLCGPSTPVPGFLATTKVIALRQSDFDSGTYRITESGYYYLTENILFEPIPNEELSRSDKPQTDWFAALSVECDNVIIDLNWPCT